MNAIKLIGYILFCCVWLQSCNVTSDQPEVIVDIESDFKAELGEELIGDSREVLLKLQSIEEVPCESAYLNFRTQEGPASIHVELLGFNQPFGCDLDIVDYVDSDIRLNKKNTNTYSLNLKLLNSFENNGSLIIHDDRYVLILENEIGFQVQFRTLMKTDHELFWGYLASDNADINLEELKSNLFLEMDDRGDYSDIATGTYSNFFIGDDGAISMRSIIENNEVKPFYFKSNGASRSTLISIVESYKSLLPDDVEMKVYTGRGETF